MTLFLSACYLEIKSWFAKCQINTAVHMCSLDYRLHAQLCLHGPNQPEIALAIFHLTKSAEASQGLLAMNCHHGHIQLIFFILGYPYFSCADTILIVSSKVIRAINKIFEQRSRKWPFERLAVASLRVGHSCCVSSLLLSFWSSSPSTKKPVQSPKSFFFSPLLS